MNYKSIKTNEVVSLISEENGNAVLKMANGETKEIKVTTLKRWWRPVVETPVEGIPETIPETISPSSKVVEEDIPVTPNPKSQNVIKKSEKAKTEKPKTEKVKSEKPETEKPVNTFDIVAVVEELASELGKAVVIDNHGLRTFNFSDELILAFTTKHILMRESVAKELGLTYEAKKYNHPYKAKLNIPETNVMLKVFLERLIK